MGSIRLSLASGQGLLWPQSCAVCGSPATHQSKASFSVTKNPRYYVVAWGWTKQTHSISFPVCHKHKLLCSFLDLPSKLGFVDSFLFLVFVPTFLWIAVSLLLVWILGLIGLKGVIHDELFMWSAVFIYGLFILFFFSAGVFKPVKISDLKEDSVRVSIKNEDCMKAFKLLNMATIIDN